MCETLGVSKSGFHAWERRAPSDRALSDAWLTSRITDIHENARGVYGSRRVQAELRLGHDIVVSRKRIRRLMKQAGISGLVKVKKGRTTAAQQQVCLAQTHQALRKNLCAGVCPHADCRGFLRQHQERHPGRLPRRVEQMAPVLPQRVRLPLQRAQQHHTLDVRDAARPGSNMSESDAIKGIRRAAKRREYAERLRHQATDDLRERMREAQSDGVPIARIAREARLSRQGVYDLLGAARPS